MTPSENDQRLRLVPRQDRSRRKFVSVLEAAEGILVEGGAAALTTTRIADVAGISVGSLYRYFPDKEAIVEALAVRYWSDFADLVAAVAETDERDPLPSPMGAAVEALAAGFRARPGFLELWFGGLRSERVRDITRPNRAQVSGSIERMLASRWPDAKPALRATVAGMVVLVGDGVLREAFRLDRDGDPTVLAEAVHVMDAYVDKRMSEG